MAKKNRTSPKRNGVPPGYVEIFTPYIRLRDGRIVYPKTAKVFHFFVKA